MLRRSGFVMAAGGERRAITPDDEQYDVPRVVTRRCPRSPASTARRLRRPRHTTARGRRRARRRAAVLTASLDRKCGPFPSVREPSGTATRSCSRSRITATTTCPRLRGRRRLRARSPRDRCHGFDAAGGDFVHAASTPTTSPSSTGRRSPIYAGEHAVRLRRALASSERFVAVAKDGTEVEAWIVRRPTSRRASAIRSCSTSTAGRSRSTGTSSSTSSRPRRAGYAVAYSNPRGSSGYSEEWGRAIRGPGERGPGWGSVDYEDLMAVVDAALSRSTSSTPSASASWAARTAAT